MFWFFVWLFFKLAKILSFKNFSEYTLTVLCAKSPENVDTFLNRLAEKMRILQKKEMELLLEYKKKHVYKYTIIQAAQAPTSFLKCDGRFAPALFLTYLLRILFLAR